MRGPHLSKQPLAFGSPTDEPWGQGQRAGWGSTYQNEAGASLVAQWLRIHLPMQETQVRALVREDPTCRGAAKPVRHNH